jgi:6-phosphogluconolactonase (cycloisomerase 2 family)
MFHRASNGDLSLVGYFPTGSLSDVDPQLGSGPAPTAQIFKLATAGKLPLVVASGDGLGSSNSLILSQDNLCLFAVNAGSNTVSSFRVLHNGLSLVSAADSRGVFPISLTEFENTLYVLNAGEAGNLAGFRVYNCALRSLGEVVSLKDLLDPTSFPTPAPGEVLTTPAQASFTPDGQRLVLSIKGLDGAEFTPEGQLVSLPNGRMVVFSVGAYGELSAPVITQFSFAQGTGGPFSFLFANAETVIIVHANSGTVASYAIKPDNTLALLSDLLPTGEFAPCWLDSDGRFVYTASFGAPSGVLEILGSPGQPDVDGVLNGFRINADGTLTPVGDPAGYPYPAPGLEQGRSGNHAIDVRVVGRFLYFVQPRLGMVGRWTISEDGTLVDLANFGGLSPGLEPTPLEGFNPGITDFLTRCFLQDPNYPSFSPECRLGSAQGIAGF